MEGGRAWRESLGKVFELPAGIVDFECPYGFKWGDKPEPDYKTKKVTPEQITKQKKYQKVIQVLVKFRTKCFGYQKIKGCKCELGMMSPCAQIGIPIEKLICEKDYFKIEVEQNVNN